MKSRWIKLCSILLVLTMLINMLPVHALALDSEDRGSASVQGDTESHTVQIIGEVEGLREEGIKHFRLSDGSFVAVSYGLPVHFQNSGGQWIDIDNRLSLAAGAYRTAGSVLVNAGKWEAVHCRTRRPVRFHVPAGYHFGGSDDLR